MEGIEVVTVIAVISDTMRARFNDLIYSYMVGSTALSLVW